MLPDVQTLIDLQLADREILRLKNEIAALPQRVSAIEQKLAGTKSDLEKAKASVKEGEASRRKYETAIQDLQQKITKYRDQSLDVKTNDQYRALMHEVQFSEQEIRSNEDKILELMVNAESREKEVKAADAELKAETAEIEAEKKIARERTAEDEKQLTEWNAKREKARAGVNADLLRHYDRVSKHRGTGLAEVREQKCMGCQVMLRPQTYNEIRSSSQTVICDSCQRILYYNPANDVVAQPAASARKRRAHPKIDAPQAWYYHPEYAGHGEVFLVFTNSHGQASRRIYDSFSGRQVGDTLIREGEYRMAFPEDFAGTIRLNGSWKEEEIDSWNSELPMTTLDALQRDLEAAKLESSARPHSSEAQNAELTPEQNIAS